MYKKPFANAEQLNSEGEALRPPPNPPPALNPPVGTAGKLRFLMRVLMQRVLLLWFERTRIAARVTKLQEPQRATFPGCSDAGLQAREQKRLSCLQP